jgi:uncharacterized protein (TIGR02246 family)
MKSKWALAVAGMAAVVAGFVVAQDKPPPDEAAIREASQAFARAFEKGDAPAFAALWTEQGEYRDEGAEPIRGRDALRKAYEGFFAKRSDLKVESKTDAVRFLGKDTAVEEGMITVRTKDGPPAASRYSALFVREGGQWLVALLKEWDDESAAGPGLDSLAWLVGSWESESADVQARTTYEWVESKKFLRARYTITTKKAGERASSGTQVIGVDPAVGLVRAWTFDAEGGIGEATWVWDDGRWVIESNGTLPDGSRTTAVNLLTRTGDDSFTWQVSRRSVNGESLPDLAPVKVKRVAGNP